MATILHRGRLAAEAEVLQAGVLQVLQSPEYLRILAACPYEELYRLDSLDSAVKPLPQPPYLQGPDELDLLERITAVLAQLHYRVELTAVPGGMVNAYGEATNGAVW